MLKTLCLSALLLTTTTAVAAPPVDQNPVPAVKVDPKTDPNHKICRREIPTGSMMTKTTCHTRAEWEAQTAAAQQMMARRQNSGIQN